MKFKINDFKHLLNGLNGFLIRYQIQVLTIKNSLLPQKTDQFCDSFEKVTDFERNLHYN